MSRLILDLKVAARTAARARFVSVLAVIAFSLGIGITTAVFSIFNGVLLAPLPFPHPEQLVMVYDTQPACATCPASFPKYHDWRERNQVFSAIGGARNFEFRWETFNLFNRMNLANPATNISAPAQFGRITGPLNSGYGTGTARQIQLMLRVNF